MPLVTRCVSSTSVASSGARGSTSPLQSGQWAPQPAPEPVARTNAPHRITSTFQPSTSQASRASDGFIAREYTRGFVSTREVRACAAWFLLYCSRSAAR